MKTIGIDLGGHTISYAEIDISSPNTRILRRIEGETPKERTLPLVSAALLRGITELAGEERELRIGIGMPGFLNKERNKIQKLTNFMEFENIPYPMLLPTAPHWAKVSAARQQAAPTFLFSHSEAA